MESIIKQLRENIVIIVFIGGLVVTWTTFNNRLAQAEGEINELKSVLSSIADMQTDIAVMRNDISYIKLKVQ